MASHRLLLQELMNRHERELQSAYKAMKQDLGLNGEVTGCDLSTFEFICEEPL